MKVDSEYEEGEFNVSPPVPRIKSYKEAVKSLEDIKMKTVGVLNRHPLLNLYWSKCQAVIHPA